MPESTNVDIHGPEYFTCVRFKAQMLKIRCIQRQEENFNLRSESFTTSEIGLSFEICRTCMQGKRIRDEVILGKQKPMRGRGERKIKCSLYNVCLDHAEKKDWQTFNCESCLLYKYKLEMLGVMEEKEKAKNTRICKTEDCGKITMSPSCPFCASCMAKRASQLREAKKKGNTKSSTLQGKVHLKEENKSQKEAVDNKGINKHFENRPTCHMGDTKLAVEIHDPGGDTRLIIEFGRHTPVLREIEQLAENELRPIDLQVIYMLKNQLKVISNIKDRN